MKVKLLRQTAIHPKRVREGFPPFYEAGHIIDNPRAYRLVQLGVAVPADKECEDKVRAILPIMDRLIFLGERSDRGIHMDEFKAYEAGLMTGYKPDGTDGDTWIHGPNWTEGCEAEYYSNDEEEDE